MTPVRPLTINLKMMVRDDCIVSVCILPSYFCLQKLLPCWLLRQVAGGWRAGRIGLWTDVHHPLPPTQLPASEVKQTFLSTNLAYFLAFEQQAARYHIFLSVT